MSVAKNVAVFGASGDLGTQVFKKLVDAKQFNLTVFRRPDSKSTLPSGTKVVDVDFNSVEALTKELNGFDVVVSTIGTFGLESQLTIIDAAIAAGVKRFIPSEFGSDLSNPKTRPLPVFATKVKTQDKLIEEAKKGSIEYTFISNAAFLDWGLEKEFLLKTSDGKTTILDGGDRVVSTTTLPTVGEGVVGVLNHLGETKNRTVYIEDLKITQNKLLQLAREVYPNKKIDTEPAEIEAMVQNSYAALGKGDYSMGTWVPFLFRSLFSEGYGGEFKNLDNELLGIKQKDDEFVKDIIRQFVKA